MAGAQPMNREAQLRESIEALTPPEDRDKARMRRSVEEIRAALGAMVGQAPDGALIKSRVRETIMRLPGVESCMVLDPELDDILTVEATIKVATPVNMVSVQAQAELPEEDQRALDVQKSIARLQPPVEEPAFEPLVPQSIQGTLDDSTFNRRHLKLWREIAKGGKP